MMPTKQELLVIAIIIAILALLLLPAVQAVKSHEPYGEMVPTEPPDEANRVRNHAGLSIVLPKDWKMNDIADAPKLHIGNMATRRHLAALLIIEPARTPSSTDLLGFTQVTFLGSEAHEKMVVERKRGFDDPAWSVYTMYFQHKGEWWWVRYAFARESTKLPPMIRHYIETFCWDGEAPIADGEEPESPSDQTTSDAQPFKELRPRPPLL